jgi:hypothetical protein
MKNQKKLFILTLISVAMLFSSAFAPFKNGKVILIISIEVKNFSDWKKSFDAGATVREKAGIKVLSICASTENENQVLVIEEAESAQAAHDFLNLLKSKQKDGEIAKLDIKLYDKAE